METSIKCVVMMVLPFIRNTFSVFTTVYKYKYRISILTFWSILSTDEMYLNDNALLIVHLHL